MNRLPNGTIAEGAPGSLARERCENEDKLKPLNVSKARFIRIVVLTYRNILKMKAQTGYSVVGSLRMILAAACKEHGVTINLNWRKA